MVASLFTTVTTAFYKNHEAPLSTYEIPVSNQISPILPNNLSLDSVLQSVLRDLFGPAMIPGSVLKELLCLCRLKRNVLILHHVDENHFVTEPFIRAVDQSCGFIRQSVINTEKIRRGVKLGSARAEWLEWTAMSLYAILEEAIRWRWIALRVVKAHETGMGRDGFVKFGGVTVIE